MDFKKFKEFMLKYETFTEEELQSMYEEEKYVEEHDL